MRPNVAIEHLHEYSPGQSVESVAKQLGVDPSGIVKLASNENPLGCPVDQADLKESLVQGHVYPDQDSHAFLESLE